MLSGDETCCDSNVISGGAVAQVACRCCGGVVRGMRVKDALSELRPGASKINTGFIFWPFGVEGFNSLQGL